MYIDTYTNGWKTIFKCLIFAKVSATISDLIFRKCRTHVFKHAFKNAFDERLVHSRNSFLSFSVFSSAWEYQVRLEDSLSCLQLLEYCKWMMCVLLLYF